MKKILYFAFLFFLFISATSWAAFYKPSLEVYTVKTEHFYIHYPKEVAPVAKDLIEIAEKVHGRLSDKLKWKPWGRTHVVLADKSDKANGLATVIPANYVLLYVTPPDADSSLDNYKDYLELLFTHEYTHILHLDQHHRVADPFHWVFGKIVAPNGLTPGWMREGMAAWEETVETGKGRGNFSYSDMLLRTSIYENNFPSIDEAAGTGTKWPGNDTQYIFGVKFWEWLSKKYGEDRIQSYMEKYSSGLWLFSLNNKAKRVYGKSFYKLWKEWKTELARQYRSLKVELEEKGLTPFEPLVTDEDNLSYPTPHPSGSKFAYFKSGKDDEDRIVITDGSEKKPTEIKRGTTGQLSFSRDGGSLFAFSNLSGIESYKNYSDVYVYDVGKKSMKRLFEKEEKKKSMRATDPDFSPEDGGNRWVVMVRTNLGTDNLYVYDLENKKGYYLTNSPKYTQFSNPRYSPGGKSIVVSRKDHKGNRDIVIYSRTGEEIKKVTNDDANDHHPVWSPNGQSIYFASDVSGIPNIHRHDVATGQTTQVTNVLTGVYQPQLTPDGSRLYVRYYTSKGFDLYRVEVSKLGFYSAGTTASPGRSAGDSQGIGLKSPSDDGINPVGFSGPVKSGSYENVLSDKTEKPDQEIIKLPGSKKYNAFPQVLVPRLVMPTFVTLDDAFLFGASTWRFDPMYRHSWNLYGNYRTDAKFLGGGASYTYLRYNPSIYVGFIRYSANRGDISGTGNDFFEQRHRGYIGSYLNLGHHGLSLSYFYEGRDNFSNIPAGVALPNLARYAGLGFNYAYGRYKKFSDSISREDGPYFKLDLDWTDSILGSASQNEQVVITGDLRYYFEMPYADHHVFGLRAAGGYEWGDRDWSGTFRFGGPLGEGTMAGYSSRLFPLRGLPVGAYSAERVLLFSAEYRLPILHVDRGVGTLPLFLNKIHMSFFADYGDSWWRNGKDNRSFFDDFFLGVGAELMGDFTVGYGLPITGRMGYAIIVVNRDQIANAGLTDDLLGNDIRYGTFYLQFGTMF